ncbi:MAG: hypothetical protein WC719_00650 [Patescibacteria group bacterium]|jgi:hypothetical protein
MKLLVNKKQLGEAPAIWLRHAGYVFIPEREDGQESFARRLSRDFYPRFHVYFTEAKDNSGQDIVTFNLHLDQKRPGYQGFSRHNAEYDGELVENELARLKSLILPDLFI